MLFYTPTKQEISDSVIYNSVIHDSVIFESMIHDSVICESVICDSAIFNLVIFDSVIWDSVNFESVINFLLLTSFGDHKIRYENESTPVLIITPRRTQSGFVSSVFVIEHFTVEVRRSRSDVQFLEQFVRFRIHHQQPGMVSSSSDYLHHLWVPQTLDISAIHLNTHTHTQSNHQVAQKSLPSPLPFPLSLPYRDHHSGEAFQINIWDQNEIRTPDKKLAVSQSDICPEDLDLTSRSPSTSQKLPSCVPHVCSHVLIPCSFSRTINRKPLRCSSKSLLHQNKALYLHTGISRKFFRKFFSHPASFVSFPVKASLARSLHTTGCSERLRSHDLIRSSTYLSPHVHSSMFYLLI